MLGGLLSSRDLLRNLGNVYFKIGKNMTWSPQPFQGRENARPVLWGPLPPLELTSLGLGKFLQLPFTSDSVSLIL